MALWLRVVAVAAFAWTAIGTPAEAQDSTAVRLVFSDVFLGRPAPAALVVLAEGTVYRIDVEPGAARVGFRVARRPGAPPLFLVPLSESGTPSGAASFLPGLSLDGTLRVPGTSGRLDAEAALGSLRIATADRESGFRR